MSKWIKDIEPFIRDNWDILSNRQFAAIIGCAPSTISWIRCRMGLKKMEMEYWTEVQIKWLHQLYPYMGDYEIALIFNEAYPKAKGWTLKHIEKKRMYLGLKRTKQQLKAIKQRNKTLGCWMVGSKNAWETRGQAERGTIKIWEGRPYIKTENGYQPYLRWLWEQHNGKIPKGMNIIRMNPDKPLDDLTNLEMISDSELGARNSISRYPKELRQLIYTLHKLNKTIYEKQDSRRA